MLKGSCKPNIPVEITSTHH